jgi:hypothetical protein
MFRLQPFLSGPWHCGWDDGWLMSSFAYQLLRIGLKRRHKDLSARETALASSGAKLSATLGKIRPRGRGCENWVVGRDLEGGDARARRGARLPQRLPPVTWPRRHGGLAT